MKKITSVILCLVLLGSLFCTADFTAFAVEKVSAIKQVAAVKTEEPTFSFYAHTHHLVVCLHRNAVLVHQLN